MTSENKLRILRNGASVAAVAAALAACSGGAGGMGVTASPPPPPPPPQEDFFGTGFGVDFRASANSEPVVPAASDIIALSLTTEPQPITFPTGS